MTSGQVCRCDKYDERHEGKDLGQMGSSGGRLVPAPDGYSDVVLADKTIGTAPVVVRMLATSGTGAGPTHNNPKASALPMPSHAKGIDMPKDTRGVPRSDSVTRTSAVKITPASSDSATVPSISSVA